MGSDFEVTIQFNNKWMDKIEDMAGKVLGKAAMDTAAGATARTTRIDTSVMKNSWRDKKIDDLEWIAGSFGCEYAIYHEFGFHAWGKYYVPPLPMLIPSFHEAWKQLKAGLRAAGFVVT